MGRKSHMLLWKWQHWFISWYYTREGGGEKQRLSTAFNLAMNWARYLSNASLDHYYYSKWATDTLLCKTYCCKAKLHNRVKYDIYLPLSYSHSFCYWCHVGLAKWLQLATFLLLLYSFFWLPCSRTSKVMNYWCPNPCNSWTNSIWNSPSHH